MADTLTRRAADMPSKDSLRKSKKPLMEKRRRARINTCLNQLKTLVLQALNKDGSHFSKLEKADILEMTVKYLRGVQRSQMHSAMSGVDTNSVRAKYRAGFNECANEVVRYVNAVHGVNDELRSRLMGHLSNCVQVVNTPTEAPASRVPLQPLYVQVPNAGVPTSHDQHAVSARQGVLLWTPQSHVLPVNNTAASPMISSNMPSPTFVSPYSQGSTSSRSSSPVSSPESSGISSPSFPETSGHIVLQRNPSPSKPLGQYQQQQQQQHPSREFESSIVKCKEEDLWRPW